MQARWPEWSFPLRALRRILGMRAGAIAYGQLPTTGHHRALSPGVNSSRAALMLLGGEMLASASASSSDDESSSSSLVDNGQQELVRRATMPQLTDARRQCDYHNDPSHRRRYNTPTAFDFDFDAAPIIRGGRPGVARRKSSSSSSSNNGNARAMWSRERRLTL